MDRMTTTNSDQLEAWVAEVGGTFERDEEHPDLPITGAAFCWQKGVTEATLNRILGIATLKRLNVSFSEATEAWLKHLSSFPALEDFSACHTPITDAGLKHIGTVSRLKVLNLTSIAQVSDAGLRALSKISELEWLEFSALENGTSHEGIASLKALSKLRHLLLEDMELLTDSTLVHLRDFPKLESLILRRGSMTASASATLGELTRLKKLNIFGNFTHGFHSAHLPLDQTRGATHRPFRGPCDRYRSLSTGRALET